MSTTLRPSTTFTTLAAAIYLLYHATLFCVCLYLPADAGYIAISATAYCLYGTLLSFLVLFGTYIGYRPSVLLSIFSNHLLVDAVVSTPPKLLLFCLVHLSTKDVCDVSPSNAIYQPRYLSPWSSGPSNQNPVDDFDWSMNTALWQDNQSSIHQNGKCKLTLFGVDALVYLFMIGWIIAQWKLGLAVRLSATMLEQNNDEGRLEEGEVSVEADQAEKAMLPLLRN